MTAEAAVLLPGLVGLLALLLGVLGQGLDHVRATDAARSAARLVARGDDEAAVRRSALAEAPDGATVEVSRQDGQVVVTVTAPGRILLPRLRLPVVSAAAVVAEEPVSTWRWP